MTENLPAGEPQELCASLNLYPDGRRLSLLKNSSQSGVCELLPKLAIERLVILSRGRGGIHDRGTAVDLLRLWEEEADDFCCRFEELLLIFGLVPSMGEEYRYAWRWLHYAGLLIPNIKYSVNVAFNRHFGELEMPEPPEFDIGLRLFPKNFRVVLGRIRSFESRRKHRSLFLINSLFQGWKKGLLPLDFVAFDRTMVKHRKALCETSGEVDEDVAEDIHRITSELLRKFRFSRRESCSWIPSTSATIEYSRGNGGSLAHLFLGFFHNDESVMPQLAIEERYHSTFLGYVRRRTEVKEIRGFGPSERELKEEEYSNLRDSLFDPYEVLPYGVVEPLKIRTITRPTYRTHWGLRGLQKELLTFLNRFPMFQITGDSNKEHLRERTSDLFQSKISSFRDFLSGDFSAATDTVKGKATAIVWDVICQRESVPWWIYIKGKKSLLETKVIYDQRIIPAGQKSSPYKDYSFESLSNDALAQTSGQLMGNILSFPILCIINYAAWHRSMEQYIGHQLTIKEAYEISAVSINGDDLLCRADSKFYALWKESVGKVGFNLSLGKNFFHREMFQINSQLFKVLFDIFGHAVDSVRIPYFNFGQLTGRKKGMDSDQMRSVVRDLEVLCSKNPSDEPERVLDIFSVGRNFREQQECVPEGMKESCLTLQKRWFNKRFRSFLDLDRLLLANLPVEVGGLGFGGKLPLKKFDSSDQITKLFSREVEHSDASLYYPESFGYSHFSPEYKFKWSKPYLPLTSMLLPTRTEWVVGHCPRAYAWIQS